MNRHQGFLDFYPRRLLEMGIKDLETIVKKQKKFREDEYFSHWLVALKGYNDLETPFYNWRVMIYLATNEGVYHYFKPPYYHSESFSTMEEAIEKAREIEELIAHDVWCKQKEKLKIG